MADTTHHTPLTTHSSPDDSGGWMFWILIGLAGAVFAPCVLVPVWREYQALQYAEQVEQAALDRARDDLLAEHRRLAALQNDPAVIARLARRDLRYSGRSETVIPIGIQNDEVIEDPAVELTPVEPPAPLAHWIAKLPEADYDRLFCPGQSRNILMGLSGGLVLAAMALFPARRGA